MRGQPEERFMRRAIGLAANGEGYVNPNPMVGAVVVKDGRIIGEGYHERFGGLHAERNALASLTGSAEGSDIYVTLEPCCHHGKTPPCTEAIIENKIGRVIIGSADPNPLVSGKGVKQLRDAGIEVVTDFLKDECDELNPVFFKYIKTGQPYVVLKYAMTMDGKIATTTGESKWITGEESRTQVQRLRHKYMAIMAGIGTVLADDPMLNVRIDGLKSPVRVICDSGLNIPIDSNIVNTADKYRTILAHAIRDEEREKALSDRSCELIYLPGGDGRVDIKGLISRLGADGIDSVLIEGGGTLNDSLIREGLADRVEVFIAPKIFGGRDAKTPVEGSGVASINEAALYELKETAYYGNDILLSYVNQNSCK
ncbi:MAG: bifunctional diaminohydroxyphosphoribosylaminopyrimidine deaminase/5-amino-6-(5-phosphoribosylamino)uracil reductase RibD [Lachnospiraceae bacterium]|nr:bifunctional diaminohydroxyphosphoribosylaminopyrimidine deaminase/5-amino-6-(5-phosphoribosylamino)uracil reductase RibD [Lachnospiraceae bacterium]